MPVRFLLRGGGISPSEVVAVNGYGGATRDERRSREWRRLRALELSRIGWKTAEIADALDFAVGTVRRLLRTAKALGDDALLATKANGPDKKLTDEMMKRLTSIVETDSPTDHGFDGEAWTSGRLVVLAWRLFGVDIDASRIQKRLKAAGFTPQRPVKKMAGRDDAAVWTWRRVEKSRLSADAEAGKTTIVWEDESGFSTAPPVVRSYARRGHPPTIRVPFDVKATSVAGIMTSDGRMIFQMQQASFSADDIVALLKRVLRLAKGHIDLVWDRAGSHVAKVVKDFVAKHADRIRVVQLPVGDPEDNPVENIWGIAKDKAANARFSGKAAVVAFARNTLAKLARRRRMILNTIRSAGYARSHSTTRAED